MSFEIIDKNNYTLVKAVNQRLDTTNAHDLKSEVVLINKKGAQNIILDLASCNYCDSSGLSAILVTNRLCEDAIGTFILCELQPDVENLIKVSMLDTVLLISKTVEEAEELLNKKENL